ncbi:oxoglutarate iron-dependent oxygenase [Colletotrichum higginsianum]|nr:oxoglutarate iron-dependent oxygenase [Colletotrichum higginsianum]
MDDDRRVDFYWLVHYADYISTAYRLFSCLGLSRHELHRRGRFDVDRHRGSTVSRVLSETTSTPEQSAAVSVITSVFGGVGSTWTLVGGSTVTDSSSTSDTVTPTLPPGASIVTSIIGGIASSWTVIGGSTVFASTSSAFATLSATPTLPPGASVVTSIVGGIASSWTVIGGSTIFESTNPTQSTPTLPPGASIVTSIVDGMVSSWTVIGGSTIFVSASSALATPTLPPGATVITSVIGGVASSWTVIGGSTIFGSASPTDAAGATVITSVVGGVASSWTVIGGSTIFGTCYVLPTPIASLHESLLNVTDREPPSIDAFYLDPATNSVKYLRLRDGNANPVLVDVSDPSRLAIIDGAGNVLSIDREGLHFTSANCSPKIDVFISGFFEQLAVLSGQSCRDTDEVPVNGTGGPSSSISVSKREVPLDARQERSFDVVLHLRDQCGDLVRPDLPVSVSLGDTECVVLPGAAGDFVASCAFPGGESNSMECETSVQQTLDHLTQGSLAGMCPSFASVWSLLSRELDRVVNFDTLLRPFIDAGLDLGSDAGRGLRSIIDGFMRLYDFSTSAFQNSTSDTGAGASSRLEDVIEEYGVAAIRTDVCRSLVSSETLALTFTAGASTAPVSLANISAVPSPRPEYERTVTDPTALACCPNASRCVVRDGQEFYPPEASIQGSDCLCGTTLEGRGVGFRTGRCVGYNQCNATSPCAGGAVCLVGSCCGFSVCVNGTECSAPAVGRRWASLFGSETSGGMF